MKFVSFTLITLFSAFTTLYAASTSRATLDVFVPPLLTPAAGTVWNANSTQTVTWDVSNPPAQITNGLGRIEVVNWNISTGLILANGFNILDGAINVTVPWMADGNQYQLVLFGDSGNRGDYFTISSGIDG